VRRAPNSPHCHCGAGSHRETALREDKRRLIIQDIGVGSNQVLWLRVLASRPTAPEKNEEPVERKIDHRRGCRASGMADQKGADDRVFPR